MDDIFPSMAVSRRFSLSRIAIVRTLLVSLQCGFELLQPLLELVGLVPPALNVEGFEKCVVSLEDHGPDAAFYRPVSHTVNDSADVTLDFRKLPPRSRPTGLRSGPPAGLLTGRVVSRAVVVAHSYEAPAGLSFLRNSETSTRQRLPPSPATGTVPLWIWLRP